MLKPKHVGGASDSKKRLFMATCAIFWG